MTTDYPDIKAETVEDFTPQKVTLTVNQKSVELEVLPWVSLLDGLRDYAGLPAQKKAVIMGSVARVPFSVTVSGY